MRTERGRWLLAAPLLLVLTFGCATRLPVDQPELASFLPADTVFYLHLNLQPERRRFFHQAVFRPVLGDEDWVQVLLDSSSAAAVGLNAQGQISAVLRNSYSKLLLSASLRSRQEWQPQDSSMVFRSADAVVDLSVPGLLYYSQQPSSTLASTVPRSSPWPPEVRPGWPQQLVVFYSPDPARLPLWQDLPLARDTLEEFWGWIGPQQGPARLVLHFTSPSIRRAQALFTNLKLVLPPLLLTSGVDVLRQQARQPQLKVEKRQLTLELGLDAEALAHLLTGLVPQPEM